MSLVVCAKPHYKAIGAMMKIKTNQVLCDLSGDNPGFEVPMGTILEVTSTENEYWVVEYEGQAFPVMFDEADIQED